MDAKILIPVRKHIEKYLTIQHGRQLVISSRGYMPLLLMRMLQKHDKQDPGLVRPSQKLIDHKIYFPYPVYIGSSYFKTKGSYISQEDLLRFNDAVHDMICEEMYRWCGHAIYGDPNTIDSVVDYNIRRFQDWYGFTEEDLPFDNLKRWYYRERERIEKRKNAEEPFDPQLTLTF